MRWAIEHEGGSEKQWLATDGVLGQPLYDPARDPADIISSLKVRDVRDFVRNKLRQREAFRQFFRQQLFSGSEIFALKHAKQKWRDVLRGDLMSALLGKDGATGVDVSDDAALLHIVKGCKDPMTHDADVQLFEEVPVVLSRFVHNGERQYRIAPLRNVFFSCPSAIERHARNSIQAFDGMSFEKEEDGKLFRKAGDKLPTIVIGEEIAAAQLQERVRKSLR